MNTPQKPQLHKHSVMPRFKFHYASSGEWGGSRVNCGRYYTTDVAHTGDKSKVTCKHCLRLLNGA